MENPRLEFEIEMNNKLSILQTYKDALENMVQIGGFWVVGQDKNLYHIEMPDKVKECMWKDAKRYDIQTGKVMGYTNADRIRSMTDEELGIALCRGGCPPTAWDEYGVLDCPKPNEEVCEEVCGSCWLDWLKQEAKE